MTGFHRSSYAKTPRADWGVTDGPHVSQQYPDGAAVFVAVYASDDDDRHLAAIGAGATADAAVWDALDYLNDTYDDDARSFAMDEYEPTTPAEWGTR